MKNVSFFPWAKSSSALGYGTTSFMSVGSTAERLALLDCAFDNGITHFDTAPLYGLGESERLLGQFLEGKRDRVTVTTKFGIEPSGAAKVRWVNLLARRVFAVAPFTKRLLKLRPPSQDSNWGIFDPAKAKESLERSLRSLRTDYVDLFLLHEPSPSDAASEALIEFLEEEVQRGRIRAYGCGGEGDTIEAIARESGPASGWLQFEDNAINRRLDKLSLSSKRYITFAPFNSALETLRDWFSRNPKECRTWSDALQMDCSSAGELAAILQATSHHRNKCGILLFSSSNWERIAQACQVAGGQRFSDEQIAEFLSLTNQFRVDVCLQSAVSC
ncbi:MAG: aldo/keto reductase [Verrucomicrobiota bacterium]